MDLFFDNYKGHLRGHFWVLFRFKKKFASQFPSNLQSRLMKMKCVAVLFVILLVFAFMASSSLTKAHGSRNFTGDSDETENLNSLNSGHNTIKSEDEATNSFGWWFQNWSWTLFTC